MNLQLCSFSGGVKLWW